jgi:hypothetical protein
VPHQRGGSGTNAQRGKTERLRARWRSRSDTTLTAHKMGCDGRGRARRNRAKRASGRGLASWFSLTFAMAEFPLARQGAAIFSGGNFAKDSTAVSLTLRRYHCDIDFEDEAAACNTLSKAVTRLPFAGVRSSFHRPNSRNVVDYPDSSSTWWRPGKPSPMCRWRCSWPTRWSARWKISSGRTNQ